ncbi:MAG: SPOR domain-containing protein [Gammaproteobacteria bacterium]|nr:SPOR domain-containing protein [Gammaproteobacteria bacterium]MDH5728196.1 SPOR domain-containing protein [Gammaproteobacteria bacterium]
MPKKASYKKSGATTLRKDVKPIPPWVWLLTGVLVGGFGSFVIYLQTGFDPKTYGISKPIPDNKTVESKTKTSEHGDDKPRFEFYTLLPELEVLVPNNNQGDESRKNAIDEPGKYELQSGSFKNHADADKRKANLALLGITSKIQTVEINDNETWHRVKVGPLTDLQELNRIRELLKRNQIDTLLVKVKG